MSLKVLTLAVLWTGLGFSALLAVPPRPWWMRILLLAAGLAVTAHIVRIGSRYRGRRRVRRREEG